MWFQVRCAIMAEQREIKRGDKITDKQGRVWMVQAVKDSKLHVSNRDTHSEIQVDNVQVLHAKK